MTTSYKADQRTLLLWQKGEVQANQAQLSCSHLLVSSVIPTMLGVIGRWGQISLQLVHLSLVSCCKLLHKSASEYHQRGLKAHNWSA